MVALSDRPVSGIDDIVDRTRGWLDPVVDQSGYMRIAVYSPEGDIMGHTYLSLIEFGKVVMSTDTQVRRIFGPEAAEDLPWRL